MNRIAISFVSVVWLMGSGGMSTPTALGRGEVTTVTSGQSEESCVWRSDISVQSLTVLGRRLIAVKTWARNAFNSTCLELTSGSADLCLLLKSSAARNEAYPVFDRHVVHTCDVQEMIRHASYVIVEYLHLIEQFSNNVSTQFSLSDVKFHDLRRLRNRLDYAKRQLGRMIGDSVLPTAVATIANTGDVTNDNLLNVMIVERVALDVEKIKAAFRLVSTHLSD